MEILYIELHIWITVALVLGMFICLLHSRIPTEIVFLSVMALLVIFGCIDGKEAISILVTQASSL